ncbi:MAG: response regulator [Gemmatimonadota bacterium]|nr:response regulator [Gemmatimonadota bacterium]
MGTVLVVDDDPTVRTVVARLIKLEGHVVLEAEDGRVALRLMADRDIDLALVDIYMPEMDGIELLMRLRGDFPRTRVVAMSGGGPVPASHVLDVATLLGATDVLQKPFGPDDVRAHLRALGRGSEDPPADVTPSG